MNIEEIKHAIELELDNVLPSDVLKIVRDYKVLGRTSVKILLAANKHEINSVRNQFPQAVSLSLRVDTMELETQVFGGIGGNRIYRKVDKNNPKEKMYAMHGIKIKFRKPKKEFKFVLRAINKFASNWLSEMKANKELLMYQDNVDYSFLDK